MTKQTEAGQEKKFACAIVPWVMAATALVLYLLTLNHWVSLGSIPYVARITGKTWMPELMGGVGHFGPFSPPMYVATYPFRWLPERWVPLALNLFSATCGALTLALLARSVALLPHDRTHQQRQREHGEFSLLSIRAAWIPPVVAVAVCGLRLPIWLSATAASGEIFDLLLWAYVIRCLLEFRISQRDSWLLRAALVYGAAMTGNWLMVGLVPVFVASVIWIRGFSFFNLRFLRGMLLCGLAGMLLYLLLPVVFVVTGNGEMSFWDAVKTNLLSQKNTLSYMVRLPSHILLFLATTSFLPVLLISVRWGSYFGDPSRLGILAATAVLHVAHGVLLSVCVWMVFDPLFSPIRKGLVMPSLDYLSALCIGYFIGYFLLVFRPLPSRLGRVPPLHALLNNIARVGVWGLLIVVPAGLIWKNLPQIRLTNGSATGQYASWLTQRLSRGSMVLCDSENPRMDLPQKLWLAQAWLARSGKAGDCVFLDTLALQFPAYHKLQQKRYPGAWPPLANPKASGALPAALLLRFVAKLAEQHPLYYLHPSFGYYFELYYPQLHGLALELKPYGTNSIARPPLTAAEINENEKFWTDSQPALEGLIQGITESGPYELSLFDRWLKQHLKIGFQPNATALTLGRYYSQSLDLWGVQLQRSGRLKEAGRHFETALALNPDNLAAKVNLESNKELRAGHKLRVPPIQTLVEEFGRFRDWQQIMREYGPFDDPTHCFAQAQTFAQGRLVRQAAQQFERIHEFDPENLFARFWLARFYANQFPDRTLALIAELRAHPETMAGAGIRSQDLSTLEAVSLFASHKETEAERVLQHAMAQNPEDEGLLSAVVQISGSFGRYTNALIAVERELQINPTNTSALIIQGYLYMQASNFDKAIPAFSRALTIDTNNYTARFDRAISYLRFNQLDLAQKDYEILEKAFPTSFRIDYGLAEIAWRREDTNAAIHYYELYLTNGIPDSEETKQVEQRLQGLKPAPQ